MELNANRGFMAMNRDLAALLSRTGDVVDTGHWQSLPDVPQTRTLELRGVTIRYPIPASQQSLALEVDPNLPWADLHFEERVGGRPTNPGQTYHLWPYFRGNVPKHQDPANGDKFSHTYMERMWPRRVGLETHQRDRCGVRYRYGDLSDVVELLHNFPYTRQAYLPIWFPEDTGAHHGERVPCTLGYHLMLRDDRLHVMYPIRSCDFLRHFRDDVYLAGRLVQWIIDQLKGDHPWSSVKPGELTMHMHSLHVFEQERTILNRMSGITDEAEFGAPV